MVRALFVLLSSLAFSGAVFAAGTITATPDAACAVQEGEVVCWGQISSIFGRPAGANDAISDPPTKLPGLRGIIALDLSSGHACATREDGRVICFGTNHRGELGSGNLRQGGRRVVRGIKRAVDVAVGGTTDHRGGEGFACAVNDDRVYCWGSNHRGQLGRSGIDNSPLALRVPVELSVSVEAGEDFACARDTVGDVRCWGGGDFNPRVVATNTTSMDVNGERICVVDRVLRCGKLGEKLKRNTLPRGDVSVGVDHVCVRAAGRVHCSGANWGGALGKSPRSLTTVRVPVKRSGEIATGFQFTCSRSGDDISCWGNNFTGALGESPRADEPRARPPQSVKLEGVKVGKVEWFHLPEKNGGGGTRRATKEEGASTSTPRARAPQRAPRH